MQAAMSQPEREDIDLNEQLNLFRQELYRFPYSPERISPNRIVRHCSRGEG